MSLLFNTLSRLWIVSVQLLSRVRLFATPWTAACQASLSITNSQSLLKLMSIESVMPSNHLILCCPPFIPPSIFPNSRIFSNESVLCIRWPKYWSFSFSISPSNEYSVDQFSSVQSVSCVRLFATPWTAAHQASQSITNSQSLLKLMSTESVMQSSHLILCHPLCHLPAIFPSIRVFSNESVIHIRWPKYWSFNFSISPSSEYSGLISFRIDCYDPLAVQGTLESLLQTTVQKHQFFGAQLSL